LELDPVLIQVTKPYLTADDRSALSDARIEIIHQDGRRYLKRTAERFDIIIVNLTDPKTALVNRYYTQEFFQEIQGKLTDTGIFCIGLLGGENYLGPELLNLNQTIYHTLRVAFNQVVIIPGDRNLYFACQDERIISDKQPELIARWIARKRNLPTQYFNEYMIEVVVQPERVKFIQEQLAKPAGIVINQDYQPTAYFYTLQLWVKQSKGIIKSIFTIVATLKLYQIILVISIGFILLVMVMMRKRHWQNPIAIVTVALSTGCIGISLELIFIYTFQALYGYVYQWIGFIIALFMLGLALGSLLGTKLTNYQPRKMLLIAELFILLLCLLNPIILNAIKNQESAVFILPLLTLIIGGVVGSEFPLCVAAYQYHHGKTQRIAVGKEAGGLMYASDLIGSAVGAITAVIVLIPIFGIIASIYLMAILKLGSIIVLSIPNFTN
ncbi:MAG: hypothetical protein N3A72_05520, partial [bacterium]|nr:hypothetical protein [bacterium]